MEKVQKKSKEIHKKIKKIAIKEAEDSLKTELADIKATQNTPSYSCSSCCCCGNKEPMNPFIRYSLICFIIIIAILIKSSFDNSNNYYLCDNSQGLEIWKGDFTPLSKSKVVLLEGLDLPATTKSSYGKQEVFPLPFRYFLDKVDAEIRSGSPFDFDMINKYLQKASEFITVPEDSEIISEYTRNVQEAYDRINNMAIIIPSRGLDNGHE